jgi:putative transposase
MAAHYTASDSYADLRDYYEGRGLGWKNEGKPRF